MMKPNCKTRHTMSTDFVHHPKSTARCLSVLCPFLKYLNADTLAIAMFVALALLSASRGKEIETRGSHFTKVTKPEEVRSSAADIQGYKFIAKDFGNKVAPNR